MPHQPLSTSDKRAAATHAGLKVFGYVVLLLMAITIVYTFYITIVNWSHIGV